MKDNCFQISENHLKYNLKKWVKKDTFDILNDISESVNLVTVNGKPRICE